YFPRMNKTLNLPSINEALAQKGLNQAGLAERLAVSREAVSNWLSGESFPRPDKLLKLGLTLGLPLDQLVNRQEPNAPVVAFRAAQNRKTTDSHIRKAQDMGRLLAELVPYLPFENLLQPATLKTPSPDHDYLQQVARRVRHDIRVDDAQTIDFQHLIRRFADLQAVLVPVLWGNKDRHENATHIYLPESRTTWIYLNLDVKIHDFKFWMAHELGHALAPDLRGEAGEDFADGFAGALLFPDALAESAYHDLRVKGEGAQLSEIMALATKHIISPITVYRQINAFAVAKGLDGLKLDKSLYGATTQFNKRFRSLSETLFDGMPVEPRTYLRTVKDDFDSPFFVALAEYLRHSGKSASFVQTVLDVGLLDAKGIFAELT
ncbi:MAG TPA: XRE family transcriptional regulator, partial [Fluviicoccus sp.]|nr:XRE family transcriptional regulator [Fluviicoccus sp.]